MKSVAGSLRLELSQYRELESFAAFASDLDAASKAQLDRGARLVQVLKQPQFDPLSVEEEVVAIVLGTGGHLDSVPVEDVQGRVGIPRLPATTTPRCSTRIRRPRSSTSTKQELDHAVKEFKKAFATTDGSSVVNEAAAEPLAEDEAGKESVKVDRPAPKK